MQTENDQHMCTTVPITLRSIGSFKIFTASQLFSEFYNQYNALFIDGVSNEWKSHMLNYIMTPAEQTEKLALRSARGCILLAKQPNEPGAMAVGKFSFRSKKSLKKSKKSKKSRK